ncbi:hypothetical protein LCGC14_2957700, partial [marine sediment metagenome]
CGIGKTCGIQDMFHLQIFVGKAELRYGPVAISAKMH